MGMSRTINSVSFRPIRPFRIATGSEDGLVCVFEGPPFKLSKRINTNCGFVNVVRYSEDGQYLAFVGSSGLVSVIEGQTSDPVWTLKHPDKSSSILGLCWLGPMSFCSVDGMGTLRVWETDNLKSKLTIGIGREDQQVGCISLLANLIVSVSLSGRLNIVSNTDNESRIVHRIEGHSTAITSMSTVFCCAQLISISAEGHLLFIKNADSDNPQMISSFDEYRLKDDKLYSTRLVSA
ncbi:hypothetical protein ACOME3_010807, partial [Neoechinorhynchus agilis]